MSRPYAFTFWQSVGPTPAYIEMCLHSQELHLADAFQHVHLDLESTKSWVPEYDLLWEMSVPAFEGKTASREARRLAIFTGMLRAALIHRHGGLWVDADTLVFPQFALLAPLVTEFDLVCGESASGGLGNAVLGGRLGSTFFEEYLSAVLTKIEVKRQRGNPGAVWGEFGFHMLRRVFVEQDPQRAWIAPWGVLNTVDPSVPRPTFEEGLSISEALSPSALDVSVFSNGVDDRGRGLSLEELRGGNTLFAQAYRVATGQDESAHLNIRDTTQLRALNRAAVMHRVARSGEEHLVDNRALRAKLRKSQARLRRTKARLDVHRDDIHRLHAQVEQLRRPLSRLRRWVRGDGSQSFPEPESPLP